MSPGIGRSPPVAQPYSSNPDTNAPDLEPSSSSREKTRPLSHMQVTHLAHSETELSPTLYVSLMGSKIDKITREEEIDEGTTAKVVKVRIQANNISEQAVSKVFYLKDEQGMACQLRYKYAVKEIDIHKMLHHENIVKALGYHTSPDKTELLLQFMPDTFHKRMCCTNTKKSYDLEEKIRLLLNICDGLAYLHDKHYIHLDLNSTNVLIDENGIAKLSDFGKTMLKGSLTPKHQACFYMAPELSRSNPDKPEGMIEAYESADYFSVAVLALIALVEFSVNDVWVSKHRFEELNNKEDKQLNPLQKVMIDHLKNHFQTWWPAFPTDKNIRPLITEQLSAEEFLQYCPPTNEHYRRIMALLLQQIIIPCLNRNPDKRIPLNNIRHILSKLLTDILNNEGTPL